MNERALELLAHASEILRERGWVQHATGATTPGVCPMGALNFATTGECNFWNFDAPGYEAAYRAMCQVLLQFGYTSVAPWNDTPGRTQEDAFWLLEKATERLRESELVNA